ncbi:putative blastopia polyprotein [Trichonephila clavata]|uniref:Putative blastopia polyprotein n=1 Tax=Trichonephila clavata TaxID=2740835 RepID=A0A8X6F9I0_TRICU|nr:putative blastopia polyprotein [Trichonephila clavata]
MHVRNTSTLSLEKTELLDKLRKLEESDLEKADKLAKLEEKYEALQEKFKIIEKRHVEKEIECASLKEKLLIVSPRTESNDYPKTSMKTKNDARKIRLLNDENTARLMQERDEMRQDEKFNIQHFQTISKAQFHKRRKKPHICKKDELVTIKTTHLGTGFKLRPMFYGPPYRIKTFKPHDKYEEKVGQHEGPFLTSTAVDVMKKWSTDEA